MDDNEPAFPRNYSSEGHNNGMSLRDYFAAKAMQAGMIGATLPGLLEKDPATLAEVAKATSAFYAIADAMMAARERA